MRVTCQKFQGKTCKNLEVNLKSKKRFHALGYISLTRCRNQNGDNLIYPLQPTNLYVDPNVQLKRGR